MIDRLIAWIGVLGCLSLLAVTGWEMAYEQGKREALANLECPKGTAYSVIDLVNGTLKCQPYWRKP